MKNKEDETYEIRNHTIEVLLRRLGGLLGEAIPKGYGFTLLIFGYKTEELFYISSAERQDMVKTMLEFVAKNPVVVEGIVRKTE